MESNQRSARHSLHSMRGIDPYLACDRFGADGRSVGKGADQRWCLAVEGISG